MRACGPRWSGPGAGKEGMSMLFKRRKKLFEVVCYEGGKEGIFMDEKSRYNGTQFMTIYKAILRDALKEAFDMDPDFGHRMAHEILQVVHAALVHAALEERMEDPRDL